MSETAVANTLADLRADQNRWLPLALGPGWHLRHCSAWGVAGGRWRGILLRDGRPAILGAWDSDRAEAEVEGTLRQSGIAAVAVPLDLLTLLDRCEQRAAEALAAMAAGAPRALGRPDEEPAAFFCGVGGAFCYVRVALGRVQSIAVVSALRVLDDLLRRALACSADAGMLAPLPDSLHREVALRARAEADPNALLEALNSGRASVGGGPTTEDAWSISSDGKGGFVRSTQEGDAPVEGGELRDLLRARRYGWVRWV